MGRLASSRGSTSSTSSCTTGSEYSNVDGRQAASIEARAVAPVAGEGHRAQERVDGVADVAGVDLLGVGEVQSSGPGSRRPTPGSPGKWWNINDPLAGPVSADLEPCPVGRERVRAHRPDSGVDGHRGGRVVLAVVEDQLEVPGVAAVGCVGVVGLGPGGVRVEGREVGGAVPVADALEVALGRAGLDAAVALVGSRGRVARSVLEDLRGVLGAVAVDDDVALVVVALADQPAEDMACVRGVGNAALGGLAVPGGDVVLGDGAPEVIGPRRSVLVQCSMRAKSPSIRGR